MALGPIEVLVVEFPGNRFTGEILPELARLVDAGTITIVDGLFVSKGADGAVDFVEFDQLGADHDVARVASLLERLDALISDEDVTELTDGMAPESSAAILVFEHTWAKPFRDAVVGAGGILRAELRVPGVAVDALLDELAALADD